MRWRLRVDSARLSNILQALYSAAVDPANRAALAQKIAVGFDATSCGIQVRDPVGVAIIGATENLTAQIPAYVEYYHAHDIWAQRGFSKLNSSQLGEDIVSTDELVKSEWYNDLVRRSEVHHLVGAAIQVGQMRLA